MDKVNTSSTSWLSDLMLDEMEMEGCDLFQQNLFDDEDLFSDDIASVLQQQQQQQPLSPVSSHSSTTSQILSFQNTTTTRFHAFDCASNTKQNEVVTELAQNENVVKRFLGHNNNNNKDHIIAERKRREKLNKGLIALASLIPGLKKMDKASVLGDAIKYLKQLQERLKVLEDQHNKNSPVVESVVTDNKPGVIHESWGDDGSSESVSHVDARVLDKDVLIRILCQKQKGILVKLLDEIQKLHLFVVTSNVLPFGDSLNITIVAKMETAYNLTINDLVKNLRVAALKTMSFIVM
ncbi:transcription factor bHLH25-like [Vicia villosa]|uniref:transcription factor bHLH25-like n=1 Tax=Vicia villosa TaxID=3911 RepID=UPI00273C9F72|nr:transcription factor bHLH25-like [Vicia villosa]